VKEKATNRLQTGIQNVTITAQPAVDEATTKVATTKVEATEEASIVCSMYISLTSGTYF
jgi:hypothetical protein